MKIGIIGGGILGMASGYYLSRMGHEIIIIEEKEHIGGLAGWFDIKNGSPIEKYHHFFSPADKSLHEMLDDLDIKKEISWKKTKLGMYRLDNIYPFSNIFNIAGFPHLNSIEKLRFIYSILKLHSFRSWSKLDKISAREWIIKTAGLKVYENIWQRLFESKFNGFVHTIPTAWFWARTKRRAKSSSIFSLKEKFGYFSNSTQILFEKLKTAIEKNGGTILTNKPVEKIIIYKNKVRGLIAAFENINLDRILCTIPLPRTNEISPELADLLPEKIRQLEYASITNVIMELKRPFSDYFWLNICDPGFPFPGIIEVTNLRPVQNTNLIYIPSYIRENDKLFNYDDNSLIQHYLPYLKMIKKNFYEKEIISARVFREKHADPYYFLNYLSALPQFSTPISGLFMANTSQIYPWTRSLSNGINYARQVSQIIGN